MNETLLKKHLNETPRMAPTDAVKLAFQSAFGCGHLLSARDACADFVRREMENVPVRKEPSFTPIGNGLCRLNLASPEVRRLSPKRIADLMILTNERVMARSENQQRFEESLNLIAQMAAQGEMPFSADEYERYLADYRAQGCPPVSHSEAYREAYQPAYRVVLECLGLLLPVIIWVDEHMGEGTVVIDGMCGSGKTTLAGLLGAVYRTQPIPMDDFFLPFDMRTAERLSQPGGNVHYERFASEVLAALPGEIGEIRWNRFDCSSGEMVERSRRNMPLNIIEGSYSHHPAFESEYQRLKALRVFVCTDEEEQLRRIAHRDPDLLESFRTRWIPLEKTYFEAYDIQERADVVLASQPSSFARQRRKPD